MNDDVTLLRRYAAEHDEAAFTELVRRNLPLVYSAALRRLNGDSHRAQDVAQTVFCALARHAERVARNPLLTTWLYVATRNAVINTLRAENRRRAREEEVAPMQEEEIEANAPPDWSTVRPFLDHAMDGLGSRDREAVLLRYFQHRSFDEIGAMLGLSADGARKRVDRALEKLRRLLGSDGVQSTSAVLTALLSTQTMSAAPSGLERVVTNAALSGTNSAATVSIFTTMTKLHIGIAATVVAAAGVGLLIQYRSITVLRADLAAAQAQTATGPSQPDKSANPRSAISRQSQPPAGLASGAGTASARAVASGELLAATAAALQQGKVSERYSAFVTALDKLTPANWREIQQAFADERKRTGLGHPEVYEIFVRRAGEVAGREVVDSYLKAGLIGIAREAMVGWASKQPEDALSWLAVGTDVTTRHQMMGAAIHGLALTEPDLAVKTLEDQPLNDRNFFANELVTSALRTIGLDGAQRQVEGMITRAAQAGTLEADYLKHVFYDYSFLRIAQSEANGTLQDTGKWLERHIGQPYVDRRVVVELATRMAKANPQETARWANAIKDPMMKQEALRALRFPASKSDS